ncbi:cytochrome P450 [Rhodocollybia butyracea]|uniref:Cytochrome P450 n=1 Tax=Rhodocollybia butyracea TaxID=206335 RepID=A0A9P5Q4C2_9AGAR|nr:cytochrome P450 [Rhodocollybia butyracea]
MNSALALLVVPIAYTLYKRHLENARQYPLPPGPKKLPIVENLFHVPRGGYLWLDYAEMCRRYESNIIHLSALGNSIIILNSAKAVSDLLDKRSSIYSSRPATVMLGELMGWGAAFIFRPNDEFWKAQRKIMNQAMPPTDPKRFHAQQISSTHDLLRVLPHSDDVMKSLQTWAAVFIMDVTYGIQGEEAKPYLPTVMAALESMSVAGTPGAFYVDQIPILKYVPEWFLGADFKRKAREWAKLRVEMTESAFNVTKERVAKGIATPSLTSVALEQMDPNQDIAQQEELIKTASVTAYGGGSDTTVAALGAGILALLMHPEVQAKAHAELDKVLGPGDLPTFSDEPSLPYISAIVKEALRENPITPLAFPHQLTQDDIYEGYFLPKDSIIMPNVWSILHNEEEYPEPHLFNPSRFLDADGKLNPDIKDPASAVFGFGRRICPGRHIALASLWIAIASILACYTIEPDLDEDGNPIPPKAEWYSGPTLFNHPLAFKCRFVPRSKDVEASLGISLS